MITRIPTAAGQPLAYDVCPLGVDAPSLSLEILRRGFLALDQHAQVDVGRAIKQHLRERLVEDFCVPPLPALPKTEAATTPVVDERPVRRHQR